MYLPRSLFLVDSPFRFELIIFLSLSKLIPPRKLVRPLQKLTFYPKVDSHLHTQDIQPANEDSLSRRPFTFRPPLGRTEFLAGGSLRAS